MARSERGFDREPSATENTSGKLIRGGLVVAGTFLVALGFIAIFIPLLPTTPLLLLAAACYARGSKKFYNWLLNNKLFGKYIRNYLKGKGVPAKTKILSVLLLWLTIGYSAMFVVRVLVGKVILVVIAVAVTLHILSIKTLNEPQHSSQSDHAD